MKSIKLILISLITMISMTGFAQEQTGSQAVLDNIHARKSVRSYTDEPVTPEQVETLLRAAYTFEQATEFHKVFAPLGGNK